MSLYSKDEQGREYQVLDTFVRAWSGSASGWQRCEVRRYDDGTVGVWRGPCSYTRDCTAEQSALFAIYRHAESALIDLEAGK